MSIADVIKHYYPGWDPPGDKKLWNPCLCPFHGDTRPSGAVSYEYDAFRCLACEVKGDAISIIRHEEEVTFAEAKRIAAKIAVGSHNPVQREPARLNRRRVFGESGAEAAARKAVWSGFRGRPCPWA